VKRQGWGIGGLPSRWCRIARRSSAAYTGRVSDITVHRNRRILAALVLMAVPGLLSAGCAAVWVTPTPEAAALQHDSGSETRTAVSESPRATPLPQETPLPTPTPPLASINVGPDLVQFWTNPNDIQGLAYDGEYLWAATSGGVVRWNASMTEWSLYTADDGLASSSTGSIAMDRDGDIWVGYPGLDAWSEYDEGTWQTYARTEAVAQQYEDLLNAQQFDYRLWARGKTSNWLWFPTHDGRVRAYDGVAWHAYGPYEGVRQETRFVAVTPDGRVWAVGDGLSTVREGYRWWEDHTLFSDIPRAEDVTSVAVDSLGQMWIGFIGAEDSGGGICSLNLEQNRWIGHLHALNPSLPRNVHNILVDRAGTVWLCGEDALTYRSLGGMWTRVPLGGQTVKCLLPVDGGQAWLGTAHGIWLLSPDGGTLEGPWTVPSPFIGGDVNHLVVVDGGGLFMGTQRGLIHAIPGADTALLLEEAVKGLALGTDRLWVSTTNGLFSVDRNLQITQVLTEPAEDLTVDHDGTPWVLMTGQSVARVADGQARSLVDLPILENALVNDMAAGRGNIWLATSQGLVRITAEGEYALLTVDDGLSDLDVRALAVAPDDTLWVGTANGLCRLQPSGRWTRFTTESTGGGLRSQTITALSVDSAGTLWMVTTAGLSVRTDRADWYYLDMYGLAAVYPESESVVWLGGKGGLHRVDLEALVAIP